MPQIRPITDLRNTIEISELCHCSGEPIFITKNGYGDMVIMSNETYEKELAAAEIFRKLLIAQRQIDAGEGVNGEQVLEQLRSKFKYDEL
ncbi:MAG: type II toxin-antitoxin system Phd/YefM family antitoxin [Oscillospiraceae bacterium]|nr:type II toxin-antitoxin system Phd/YefM family antitoxin [Oscillospiraceae bacterium]